MFRILLILGVILLTAVFIVARFIIGNQSSGVPTLSLKNFSVKDRDSSVTEITQVSTTSGTLENRIRELEFSVTDILNQPKSSSAPATTSLDNKIATLETSINDLSTRIAKLETGTTITATSTTKSPVYISLAGSGSSSVGDWATISGTVVTIDTGDYPGYTSMQFESNIQIFQQGTAYARISNKTDGTSILSSEISTTATSYTNMISSKFSLPGGKKDYQLQLKSLITGYAASVQNARIKVNF